MSWTTHNLLLLDWDRYGPYAGTQQIMNAALGGILACTASKPIARLLTWDFIR